MFFNRRIDIRINALPQDEDDDDDRLYVFEKKCPTYTADFLWLDAQEESTFVDVDDAVKVCGDEMTVSQINKKKC